MAERTEYSKTKESISDGNLKKLIDLIGEVKFGSITVVIQDGKVIQLERNEKLRLT